MKRFRAALPFALICLTVLPLRAEWIREFRFGAPYTPHPAFTHVEPDMVYTAERGYGWEPGASLQADRRGVHSDQPFYFSCRVPQEGNYEVILITGIPQQDPPVVVKAELRRLMLDGSRALANGHHVARFNVNVRTPQIAAANGVAAGEVRLKAPRETTQEAWAWDDAITLEFNGPHPRVMSLTIRPAPADLPTVFLLGDSTVCDQSREPFTSWGQILPWYFNDQIAVANHGESGETYRDSIGRRRLDKVISVMKPGDYLFLEFGHNDQKQIKAGTGGPFTTYADELRQHIHAAQAVGGLPVVVSPMERRGFEPDGSVTPSLADYATAARQVAEAEQVPFIDLNAMSKILYPALGEAGSATAFAAPNGKQDNTHHNNYGARLIAACMVKGIQAQVPALAAYLRPDLPTFDPAHPPAEAEVHIPPSPLVTNVRPLGN